MIQSENKTNRREQILEIAVILFASKGYHKTKISDIVKTAGIAQGTFYWHFKSKEQAALEIIHNGQEGLLQIVSKGYRKIPGTVQDSIKASEKLFEELFMFASENRYVTEMIFKGIESEEAVEKAILEIRLKLEEAFQQNITRAMDLGILPKKDAALQAALLLSLIEGILSRWLFGPVLLSSKTASQLAKEVVRFKFFGLLGI